MKKIGLLSMACVWIMSCSSSSDDMLECNCGEIVSDRVSDYSVVIRNECSGNEKRFTLNQGDWMNAHPGSDYCITNEEGW